MTDTDTEQAEKTEIEDEEVLESTEQEETEETEQPAADAENAEQAENAESEEEASEEEEEEIVVEVEGETPAPEEQEDPENGVPKKLRGVIKDKNVVIKGQNRRIKELEEKLGIKQAEDNPALKPLRKKPTLADPGTGEEKDSYNTDVYERELDKWKEEEAAHKKAKTEEEGRIKQEQEAWNKTLESYNERKKAFKAPDFDDVETLVDDALDNKKQALIVRYTKSPELVKYAIGKRPDLLKKLSEEKDLAQFLADVVTLENKTSVKTRKVTTSPETRVENSTSPSNAGPNKHRQKLVALADATGNRTELIRFDRKRTEALKRKNRK